MHALFGPPHTKLFKSNTQANAYTSAVIIIFTQIRGKGGRGSPSLGWWDF